MLFIAFQFNMEYSQMKSELSPKEYFSQLRNISDVFMNSVNFMFTLVVIICEADWPTIETRRVLVALMMIFLWTKMFEFLKVFDSTSFFVKLIQDTIMDIGPFMLILPLFILAFGTSMMILNFERDDDTTIMDSYTGFWVWDICVNQYLLALGDWENVVLEGSATSLVTIFFIMATFFTFITAFNMLIAIMSDTFGKVLEGYEQHTRSMKLELVNSYKAYLNIKDHKSFIILVTPTDYDSED